jgi:hypothetical protein
VHSSLLLLRRDCSLYDVRVAKKPYSQRVACQHGAAKKIARKSLSRPMRGRLFNEAAIFIPCRVILPFGKGAQGDIGRAKKSSNLRVLWLCIHRQIRESFAFGRIAGRSPVAFSRVSVTMRIDKINGRESALQLRSAGKVHSRNSKAQRLIYPPVLC